MAVDTATYIGDFDLSKPANADSPAEGDDNFRHVKTVLKTTLGGLTGAVTATHTNLNTVDTSTSLTTLLAAKAPTASPTFTGTVVLPSTTSIGSVSNTELGYLDGVTSAIQTQINIKGITTWTSKATGFTAAANNAYYSTASATMTLPASAGLAVGDAVEYSTDGSASKIAPDGTDLINGKSGTTGNIPKNCAVRLTWTGISACGWSAVFGTTNP